MSENNHLTNGRFLHDLDNWTVTGAAYSAGDGDDHYGVAVLSTGGDVISQTFSVPKLRQYSLHLAVKGLLSGSEATAVITDGDGNTVVTQNLSGADGSWTDNDFTIGLAYGTTYTLTITNASAAGDIKIDDVWLWYVPISRANIAARVAAKLARLATERSLSATASGSLTEGNYTYAIDAGLRAYGGISPETGLPDTRYLLPNDVQGVIELVEKEMLEQLENDFAVESDVQVGPRRENRSQIVAALSRKTGTDRDGSGAATVVQRKMIYDN